MTINEETTTTVDFALIDVAGSSQLELRYWRWYTNSWGNNPDEDWWDVEYTLDGSGWTSLEHTQQTTDGYEYREFALTGMELTESVQFRFVAADENGGSLVEAAVDDFLLTSTVDGVLAQRLVRTLCPVCRVKQPVDGDRRQAGLPTQRMVRRVDPGIGDERLHVPGDVLRPAPAGLDGYCMLLYHKLTYTN